MNAQQIQVRTNLQAQIVHTVTQGNNHVRAYLGKHGELRIVQVRVKEDANIESGKQEEIHTPVLTYNAREWLHYGP